MRKLSYSMSVSLDGFIAGPGGEIDWSAPDLAAACIKLGLVDEFGLFVNPVVLGGGTPFFPALDERLNLELIETRAFGSPVVYLRYRAR